jgi:fibronectin type 3 domain-containing protein
LTATAASSSQINLTWTASTDNVGVTGYKVERCSGASCTTFAQIATPTTTSYSDTGLTASTSYSYRVRATDAAGNLGSYSSTASATTNAGGGSGALTGSGTSVTTTANLTGEGSNDWLHWGTALIRKAGVTSQVSNYLIVGSGAVQVYSNDLRALSWTDGTPTVSGTDNNGIFINASGNGYSFTAPADTTTRVLTVHVGGWNSSGTLTAHLSDGSAANFVDSTALASGQYDRNYTLTYSAASAGQTLTISWVMSSGTGNVTLNGAALQASTDTTPPSAPSGLTATAASGSQINLSWTASTDNVGVTGYKVERCSGASCSTFAQIATPTATSYSDTGLTASTSYSYRVRATDAASNLSVYSGTATASTQAPPDTTPPTAPGTPTATVISSTQVNLTWGASTDAVGVAGYKIERCTGASCTTLAQIATSATTNSSNTGLTASTTYRYQVKGYDAAGNTSSASTPLVNATTQAAPDTTPPTAPGAPTATVISSTQINLSWAPSTDAVGVTGYKIERCTGASCTTFAQIATPTTTTYSDTGLTPSTSYSYRVSATDAAGNLSTFSTVSTATTQVAPDTTPPTAPSNVAVTVISQQATLTWTASTDNVGVTGYFVERCAGTGCSNFAQMGSVPTPGYVDSALGGTIFYIYRVRATDAAGNLSAYSGTTSCTSAECD